jgi:hypothetical protein
MLLLIRPNSTFGAFYLPAKPGQLDVVGGFLFAQFIILEILPCFDRIT